MENPFEAQEERHDIAVFHPVRGRRVVNLYDDKAVLRAKEQGFKDSPLKFWNALIVEQRVKEGFFNQENRVPEDALNEVARHGELQKPKPSNPFSGDEDRGDLQELVPGADVVADIGERLDASSSLEALRGEGVGLQDTRHSNKTVKAVVSPKGKSGSRA